MLIIKRKDLNSSVERFSVAVIGGGASGIVASISAARLGTSVVLCEKMPQLGKKLLASGNGRCNLLNEDLSDMNYNLSARKLVNSIFNQFGKNDILRFFKDLGLEVYCKENRFFPVTNQASSVLKILEMEVERLDIQVLFSFNCSALSLSEDNIIVFSQDGRRIECRKVILTGGGRTYPAYGSDGSMYEVVQKLGHTIIEPVPAVVPLIIKDNLCQYLQGQRILANVRSVINKREGKQISGELLFTQYGLSGTSILDVSEEISIALNRKHLTDVFISVDMVPFMDDNKLFSELTKRRKLKLLNDDMLMGILPNKLSTTLKNLFEIDDLNEAVKSLKHRCFKVKGTRGWNEAEFTSGGVDIHEVKEGTLESKIKKGVYFAGEILDVNGKRGGFNLGWAWASGFVAGMKSISVNPGFISLITIAWWICCRAIW